MNRRRTILVSIAAAAAGVVGIGAVAGAHDGGGPSRRLSGFQEVPALSTSGMGEFTASLNRAGDTLRYRLSFSDLESGATQAHIHFENRTNNGPIVVCLCSNLGNGPVGTHTCPAAGGTLTGPIAAGDVGAGATTQGRAAGEFDELVRAIRAGATYVNVHTADHPGGEIRAQLSDVHRGH